MEATAASGSPVMDMDKDMDMVQEAVARSATTLVLLGLRQSGTCHQATCKTLVLVVPRPRRTVIRTTRREHLATS